ncbi:MAG: T9SS type A sorting domain-containing protein, partial [Paludibacteraceae bacterium]|nr:T9SS type A sorting domain-containing protein [Paludibacteraceae bacterium]
GQSYHFNIAPTTDDDFRFIVLEHPMKEQPFVPTGNDPVGANTYIWVDANNLHIENASASSVAMLYTTDSKLLLSKNIHHNAIIPIRNLIPGMYIVKVDGKLMKFVKE